MTDSEFESSGGTNKYKNLKTKFNKFNFVLSLFNEGIGDSDFFF